ncbi:uncharacterized protein EMH_0041300 [Eimeria mitis]|uniref:Uncharacterized protein n=1 Tax=Eimeria mitis TaxID=44415 RepID=U6KGK6_9EIME|nr:uncharacterized protein EMH_0041300 [Eimeria mitis]CDJ35901.1 hypothetical protein, conserved [Eimeria mitis]
MESSNDPNCPATHQTPASSMRGEAIPDEILPSEITSSNHRSAEQRHLLSCKSPPTCKTDTEGPAVGSTGDEQPGSVLTGRDGSAQQTLQEREGGVTCETQTSTEYLASISQLKKLDLRPCAFTSLADAFQASLCVVRYLRGVVRQHAGCAEIRVGGKQPGNEGSPQGLHAEGCSVAADDLSYQEAFVADDTAYHHLLRQPSCAPQEPSDAPAQQTSDGASETSRKGRSIPHPDSSLPAKRTSTPCGGSKLAHGEIVSPLSDPSAAPGILTSTRTQIQGRLEYELSVCKALLLLQHLTPNSTTTVEESPSLSSPQSVPPQCIAGRAPSCSAYSTTKRVTEFTGVSDSICRGFQATILEILLRVRLLQGTQQLVRADFAKLLHQQQKQQQQLLKAVQTTVMKLEAERDSLLARMQKLSTFRYKVFLQGLA